MRKKSNPLKKPKHRVKPKTYRKRPKNTKRKTAIYNLYNDKHLGDKLKINILGRLLAFIIFAYFILSTVFVLRLNQPADKLLAPDQMNTPDNMFNTTKINQILELYKLPKTKTWKSLDKLNVKQIVTTNGEAINSSETVNRDPTVFAEVNFQGGATDHLLQVAGDLKMEQLPIFGIPAARGVMVMGEWSRDNGDINIENFFKISDDSVKKDSRFSDTPNNPELFNLYRQVVIEQLSAMYDLNMLNSKQKDVGEFVIYLTELPALPIGLNPFSVSHAWHQDGNPISVQTDSGADELSVLNRGVKGYNCTECANFSIYDIKMTMTYATEGRTAPWRHIKDNGGEATITPIQSVTRGNTAIADQSKNIQHGAYTSGSLVDPSLATFRRALVVFITENGKEWERTPGLTQIEI